MLTTEAELKCIYDQLAKEALRDEFLSELQQTWNQETILPHETIAIHIGKEKATGNIGTLLRHHSGRIQAKIFYTEKKIMTATAFDLIDWTLLGRVLEKKPQLFCQWLTKHTSKFCATNRMQ